MVQRFRAQGPGRMEKKMETTIVYRGRICIYKDEGKDNGNYYSIFGLYIYI